MSKIENPLLTETVGENFIDYNGHMTDSAYAVIFSKAVDQLMVEIGIDEGFREKTNYSIYTLETHLCYLQEAHEGQIVSVHLQLLDYDTKRLHVFFIMENDRGERLATSEQMLMGMNMSTGRPAPFPDEIKEKIIELHEAHIEMEVPKEAGRKIAIRRK
ncbi:thioesterase family protein [Bacillus sp. B15-48]|uniref:thioesterase family protein n=1 Tax=Bacillus sp. B15-48 TaxID=1548601 RepID=UPI00193EC9D4|nr:thioesterase family protein [Bacillus sp. B15-48]MBM4763572.1 thioesterase [Bacillus sp. B15-48]